jgi:hypothetical protein
MQAWAQVMRNRQVDTDALEAPASQQLQVITRYRREWTVRRSSFAFEWFTYVRLEQNRRHSI